MYDFERFKASAFKNKYETAFESAGRPISYGSLYGKVNALYNALTNMGVCGTALVFCSCRQTASVIALALSKCGVKRVLADEKSPCHTAGELVKKHLPGVVFLTASEASRLAPTLLEKGIKSAVTVGECENFFPAQFELSYLLEKNDFKVIKDYKATNGIEFSDSADSEIPDFSGFEKRDGTFIDIPVFCPLGAAILSEFLYSGRKCSEGFEITPKSFKKHKIARVITEQSRRGVYRDIKCETIVLDTGKTRIDGSFFEREEISKTLSSVTDAAVSVTYNGAAVCVNVLFPQNRVADDPALQEDISKIRRKALDLLYPFNIKKMIEIKRECKNFPERKKQDK